MAGWGIKATTPLSTKAVLFRVRFISTSCPLGLSYVHACMRACVRTFASDRVSKNFTLFSLPDKLYSMPERKRSTPEREASGDIGMVRVTARMENRENRLTVLL